MLTVTNGDVTYVRRTNPERRPSEHPVGRSLSNPPDDSDVTVLLPPTTDCTLELRRMHSPQLPAGKPSNHHYPRDRSRK